MSVATRDKRREEKRAEQNRKIQKLRTQIADACVSINQISGELRKTDPEEESKLMKQCRQIEDSISDIRRKYKEIERLEYIEIE